MSSPSTYGKTSLLEKVSLVGAVLSLPFVIVFSLLVSSFTAKDKYKTWKRVIGDSAFRYMSSHLKIAQLQAASGTTLDVYKKWSKQNGLTPVVEEIEEGARLLWFGQKRTDKVILYIHGGVFCFPMFDFATSFWQYVLEDLNHKNLQVGFVVLNYSQVPTAQFPVQFRQAVAAVHHLVAIGVQPENLQIVGDSAGGTLIIQLLSHILHPMPDVPRISLPSKLRGVYLMSPWVALAGDTGSYFSNSDSDVISGHSWRYYGKQILPAIPRTQNVYVEAANAPKDWFHGVQELVESVLITVGGHECLRDDVVRFGEAFSRYHDQTRLEVQEGGVHDDPFFDFSAKEKKLGKLTPLIIAWLAQGFR